MIKISFYYVCRHVIWELINVCTCLFELLTLTRPEIAIQIIKG